MRGRWHPCLFCLASSKFILKPDSQKTLQPLAYWSGPQWWSSAQPASQLSSMQDKIHSENITHRQNANCGFHMEEAATIAGTRRWLDKQSLLSFLISSRVIQEGGDCHHRLSAIKASVMEPPSSVPREGLKTGDNLGWWMNESRWTYFLNSHDNHEGEGRWSWDHVRILEGTKIWGVIPSGTMWTVSECTCELKSSSV